MPTTSELVIPADFAVALAAVPAADRVFRSLPPSHRREYLAWIAEAKKPDTRQRRIAKAVQMVLAGGANKS